MKDDEYLWDRSGEPDRDVERLEHLLAGLRHQRPSLTFPPAAAALPGRRAVAWRGPAITLALAATLVFLVRGSWPRSDLSPISWRVERLEGAPTVGSSSIASPSAIRADQWIETDLGSSVRLGASGIGFVDIGPGSRVRFVRSRRGEHRLALERGILHARIWASPGQFYVETPSATAIDLGCAYALEVDGAGAAVLHVTSGWVGLEGGGRESFVPADATCATRPGHGPGIPRFDDAPAAFADALAMLEADGSGDDRHNALVVVLGTARDRDAFTLWHLLTRVDRSTAERVFDRLVALAPPPAGVRRDDVLAGNRAALDAWWDSFGLGDASWFRRFTAAGRH
jgi:hypothetical protein